MEHSRRTFLTAGAALWLAPADALRRHAALVSAHLPLGPDQYHRARSRRYDIAWWREYWKRTEVQGVIINAGGIVAYYPSKFPLHHRAEFLNGRDLYGELAKAAHDDGLAVLARMDSNRTAEDFYQAHPDWFARDADGQALSRGGQVRHVRQQPLLRRVHPRRPARDHRALPSRGIHRQQLERTGPRQHLLLRQLRAQVPRQDRPGAPARKDWDDPVYRQWISGTTSAASKSGT